MRESEVTLAPKMLESKNDVARCRHCRGELDYGGGTRTDTSREREASALFLYPYEHHIGRFLRKLRYAWPLECLPRRSRAHMHMAYPLISTMASEASYEDGRIRAWTRIRCYARCDAMHFSAASCGSLCGQSSSFYLSGFI